MKHEKYNILILALAVVLGVLVGLTSKSTHSFKSNQDANKYQSKLNKLISFIDESYVEKVNTDEIVDEVIEQVLNKLDPHSTYIPKQDYQSSSENLMGNFVGIGIQFFIKNDSIVVVDVLEDGPSERAGIQAGDRILMANKDTLFGKNLNSEDIVSKLKGIPFSKVSLKVYRKSNGAYSNYNLSREQVKIKSVSAAFMIDKTTAYIKLDRFSINSSKEVKEKLSLFKQHGAKSLIFDLRGNGGGFIHVANEIADEFLSKGELIVYTENNKQIKEHYYATDDGQFEKEKIYILIDENSASASEIIAGAIQDNDRGLIVGRRSYGKGLVQQEVELEDGSAVRITTAKYYTPTGRSIQKPYHKERFDNYYDDHNNRLENGELFYKDSIKINSEDKFITPKGKMVYGGGGIVPDVFVALDTTRTFVQFLSTTINDYNFNNVDNNRSYFETLTQETIGYFCSIDGEYFQTFMEEYQLDNLMTENQKKELLTFVKADLVKQIAGNEAYNKEMIKTDLMVNEVLKLEQESIFKQ